LDSQTSIFVIQAFGWVWGPADMPRAYSQDLRDRVIDAVVRGGETRRGAARRFGVSDASAIKWLQRYERAGDRHCAGTGGHRPSKVKPEGEWLLAVIAAEPDITLAALSARLLAERGVKADTGMLSRFFIGEGISFKKKRAAVRTGSARRGALPRTLATLSGRA
jgi:transposase